MAARDIDAYDFVEKCFVNGVKISESAVLRLGSLAHSTLKDTPLVIYYLKNGGWRFEKVMRAFDEGGADWNVCDEDGNTCLHLVIEHYNLSFMTMKTVMIMMNSGANPMLKNNADESAIDLAIKDRVLEHVIRAIETALKYVLNDQNVLQLLISKAHPSIYHSISDLVVHPEIIVTCDHLIAFLELPVAENSMLITDKILIRFVKSDELIDEVRLRRPQLLIDITMILVTLKRRYKRPITEWAALFKMDIKY